MPLYQYECEKCGERFDIRQKFVDSPLTVHENCGGAVHRLLSAPALQFKGSGFYITDYAKNATSSGANGPAKKSDASSGEKSDSSGKTSSSSDKAGESKSSDSKSSETKSSESKSSESKPAPSSDTK